MPILNKLKSLLKTDDLLPSLSLFPEVDQEKVCRDLDLEGEGARRGSRNLPAQSTTSADHVETSIISRIEGLRRDGLENFEGNRQVYSERLSRAATLRKEVEIVAGNASSDYLTAVRGWKSAMTGSTERLHDTFQHRKDFRERHGLRRPAKLFEGWVKFAAVTIIFIGVEACLNAVMFSRGNEQGLAGGLLTALIFSAVNVIASLMLGIAGCYVNHSNIIRKTFGLLCLVGWIVFALALNLTVAHFRDLIDAQVEWAEAVQLAVPALRADPIGLTSMDSWFLLAIGSIISVSAFIKGWHTFDQFPGYSKVEKELLIARDKHHGDFEQAIEELTEKREDAIEELRDADQQVRDGISQAIDALYGHSALTAHLQSFLNQCDTKLAHLLAIYRDANISARSEPPPPSFSKQHSFPAFQTAIPVDDTRRKTAEAEVDKVTEAVETAIRDIFESFRTAVIEFQLPEEIQKGVMATSPPAAAGTRVGEVN